MKSLVVNIFGGAGCGKSTCAAGVFSDLKLRHISCELVTEYAKELVWRKHLETLSNQLKVTATQYDRQLAVKDKVEVILTDSPILLGILYPGRSTTPSFKPLVLELFNQFNNLNVFIQRNPDVYTYDQTGRNQTQDEAIAKDLELKALLDAERIPYVTIQMAGRETIDEIVRLVDKTRS